MSFHPRQVKYRVGDLLEADLPAWGHGVNLEGVMGSGIARLVRAKYPEVFTSYRDLVFSGDFWPGASQAVVTDDGTVVYNMATQVRQGPNADLDLIRSALSDAMIDLHLREIPLFGIPLIGSGIGGLSWRNDVEPVVSQVQEAFTETQIVVFVLRGADIT